MPEAKFCTLDHILVKPFQRFCRYPYFFRVNFSFSPFPPLGIILLIILKIQHFASKLNDEDKDEIELLFSIASQFVESSPTSSSATIAPSTISETVQILNKLLPSLKGEVSFLPFAL